MMQELVVHAWKQIDELTALEKENLDRIEWRKQQKMTTDNINWIEWLADNVASCTKGHRFLSNFIDDVQLL